jgi:hypothetical protein
MSGGLLFPSNLADKSSASQQTYTGNVSAPIILASGITGATQASRYAGATASGAPVSGTFAVGDFIVDQTAKVWVCTVAGTPGTWLDVASTRLALTGGTMSGVIAMGANKITGLANGSAASDAAAFGQITAATAGAVALSAVTTAGDLIYGTGSSVVTRLGLGAAGTVLVAGSSAPTWQGGELAMVVTSASASDVANSSVITTGTCTRTLPSAPADGVIEEYINTSGTLTIARGGTDTITAPWASAQTSLAIGVGCNVKLRYKASSGIWYVVESNVKPYGYALSTIGSGQLDTTFSQLPLNGAQTLGYGMTIVSNNFVAPLAGVYHCSGATAISTTANCAYITMIYKNGARILDGTPSYGTGPVFSTAQSAASGLLVLAANDTIGVWAYHAGGGTSNWGGGLAFTMWASIAYIGPA